MKFGEVHKSFCREQNLCSTSLRFFIDGQRIVDSDTPMTLGLVSSVIIDAFTEMKGGGPAGKKKVISKEEIMKQLEMLSDDDEITLDNEDMRKITSTECNLSQKIPEDESKQVFIASNADSVSPNEKGEAIDLTSKSLNYSRLDVEEVGEPERNSGSQLKTPTCDIEQDETNKNAVEDVYEGTLMKTDKYVSADNWIDQLRTLNKQGKLRKDSPIDSKIIMLLGQPHLEPVEMQMLNSLAERREIHGEWKKETEGLHEGVHKVKNKNSKRKAGIRKAQTERNLRKRITSHQAQINSNDVENVKLIETQREDLSISNNSAAVGGQIQRVKHLPPDHLKVTNPDFNNQVQLPSPSKEELKRMYQNVVQENLAMKEKWKVPKPRQAEMPLACNKLQEKSIRCDIEHCEKMFQTQVGLRKHLEEKHGLNKEMRENTLNKKVQECPFCSKSYAYVDQHINKVHREIASEKQCEVCKQKLKDIDMTMKAHRGICVFCPFCDYKNSVRKRLLKHIESCRNSEQTEPLDFTTPKKNKLASTSVDEAVHPRQESLKQGEVKPIEKCSEFQRTPKRNSKSSEGTIPRKLPMNEYSKQVGKDLNVEQQGRPLKIKRSKYPFDKDNFTEAYESELELDDADESTINRRFNKDQLEIDLRGIDSLTNEANLGDEDITKKFNSYMKTKTMGSKKQSGYALMKEPSTVAIYTRAVKNHILPAFHDLFSPFDARWIIDCTTTKLCKFDGKERQRVNPEDPIFMTSMIIKHALKIEEEQINIPRGTILSAAIQFMNFIEMHFNDNLSLYGSHSFEQVRMYHAGVKKFIEGSGYWKLCNDEKDKTLNDNRIYKEHQDPNLEANRLRRYKECLASAERIATLNKAMDTSKEKVTDAEWNETTKIVMGEVEFSTGCRSIVLRHLNNGAYADKVPGFNPFNISKEDCVVEEEQGGDKIYRRVNPNILPQNQACVHQKANNSAECQEMCDKRCLPDGYNIFVTWDKTQSSRGSSYLHLVKPNKDLMDIYDLKKQTFFAGKSSPVTSNPDWLNDYETPFFLNAKGGTLVFLDLKHISIAMEMDVTSYSFRKIVSTWGQSHESKEIRMAESGTLQHNDKVARTNYHQSRQIEPQLFVQNYTKEEKLFPKKDKRNN